MELKSARFHTMYPQSPRKLYIQRTCLGLYCRRDNRCTSVLCRVLVASRRLYLRHTEERVPCNNRSLSDQVKHGCIEERKRSAFLNSTPLRPPHPYLRTVFALACAASLRRRNYPSLLLSFSLSSPPPSAKVRADSPGGSIYLHLSFRSNHRTSLCSFKGRRWLPWHSGRTFALGPPSTNNTPPPPTRYCVLYLLHNSQQTHILILSSQALLFFLSIAGRRTATLPLASPWTLPA